MEEREEHNKILFLVRKEEIKTFHQHKFGDSCKKIKYVVSYIKEEIKNWI